MFVPLSDANTVNQYTTIATPLAWRACETFAPHEGKGILASVASDVFMLGCTFVEVLTGCTREPYDWLIAEDASGMKLKAYRTNVATMNNNPLVVRVST